MYAKKNNKNRRNPKSCIFICMRILIATLELQKLEVIKMPHNKLMS